MEEEKQPVIFHKIEAGKKVRIFKNTYNDKNFYKIQITQTNYSTKEKEKFYEQVVFKRGVDLPNETDIIIKCAYENCRQNPKDPYNPIMYLNIIDFEQLESQEQLEEKAYDEFRDNLNDIEISDEEIPF